jgi:quercetin dioxygenase-like cupin family protein
MVMATKPNKPYLFARGEGAARWLLGGLAFVKATGEQTGGTLSLVELVLPAGFATPYHIHRDEDQAFYVVEGNVAFVCDDQALKAGPGTYLYAPRGIAHGYRAEVESRLLEFAFPAGFDEFVMELSEPAQGLSMPPSTPPDISRLMAVTARFNINVLGPLPG